MKKGTNRKNGKALVLALTMMSCLSVVGISAYFTDGDTAVNAFTVGKISLELQEPNWVEADAQNILPEQEIRKDPQVLNNGTNDEFVFLEVVIPYANIQTANETGAWNAAADVELFSYDLNSDDWVQVGEASKDESAKTMTYVYAYAQGETMTVLSKDTTTPALFEYVRFADVVESQQLDGTALQMEINAYGIQTTNLNDGDITIDGDNADGKTSPADVWAVVNAKKPAVE